MSTSSISSALEQDLVGQALVDRRAGDRRDRVGDALEVLDVERLTTWIPASRMTSTSSQRFARAEPGTFVWASSSIRATVGGAGDDRVGVHLLDDDAAVLDPPARHDLEAVEQLERVRPAVGLDEADHEIRPATQPAMALLEHPERLADARRHAEVDPQPAAAARRLGADARQHLVAPSAGRRTRRARGRRSLSGGRPGRG